MHYAMQVIAEIMYAKNPFSATIVWIFMDPQLGVVLLGIMYYTDQVVA